MGFNYKNALQAKLKTLEYICIKETGTQFAYRFMFPSLGKSYPIREYRVPEYVQWINC